MLLGRCVSPQVAAQHAPAMHGFPAQTHQRHPAYAAGPHECSRTPSHRHTTTHVPHAHERSANRLWLLMVEVADGSTQPARQLNAGVALGGAAVLSGDAWAALSQDGTALCSTPLPAVGIKCTPVGSICSSGGGAGARLTAAGPSTFALACADGEAAAALRLRGWCHVRQCRVPLCSVCASVLCACAP